MGSGNGQHRARRHRQDKKGSSVLVVQQSTQQVPKNDGQPKPHSAPKPAPGTNGTGVLPMTPPSNSAPEKNTVPAPSTSVPEKKPLVPVEEPVASVERPQPLPSMKTSRHTGQNTPTPRSDLTDMLDTLRELFVHDRAIGSRSDATRCGICYLMFTQEEVVYREAEGVYVCVNCAGALGSQRLPMLRRQKK